MDRALSDYIHDVHAHHNSLMVLHKLIKGAKILHVEVPLHVVIIYMPINYRFISINTWSRFSYYDYQWLDFISQASSAV